MEFIYLCVLLFAYFIGLWLLDFRFFLHSHIDTQFLIAYLV